MRLHNLKPRPGAKHRIKRLGCGESSGLGKTSGRGHKGQKSRSGGGVRIGFEGGQMPIFRRLPKKGFSNVRFAKVYAIANITDLEARFDDGATVNEESLRAAGLISGRYDRVKILGNGEITKKLTIEADKVSKSAQEKIESAGGSVNIIEHPVREKGVKSPANEAKAKAKARAKAKSAPAPVAEAAPEPDPTPEPVPEAPTPEAASESEAPAESEDEKPEV
ncbi:MAG: large subunit ribosomal protein L15 [Pseudoalteromonas tetraodonis]|jgi:large subunit ribosomal protein L15